MLCGCILNESECAEGSVYGKRSDFTLLDLREEDGIAEQVLFCSFCSDFAD